jgi:hypothetical protein
LTKPRNRIQEQVAGDGPAAFRDVEHLAGIALVGVDRHAVDLHRVAGGPGQQHARARNGHKAEAAVGVGRAIEGLARRFRRELVLGQWAEVHHALHHATTGDLVENAPRDNHAPRQFDVRLERSEPGFISQPQRASDQRCVLRGDDVQGILMSLA